MAFRSLSPKFWVSVRLLVFFAWAWGGLTNSAAAQNISTVAGDGTQGFSGDGGPATLAQLADIDGVAVDPSGNLYIVDSSNNRIRRVDGITQVITTVAGNGDKNYTGDGGPATLASFNDIDSVAIDNAGNILIVDTGNEVVRLVNAATNIVSTVAGDGTVGYAGDGNAATSARMNFPEAVAVDGQGNLYIADDHNNVIRRVDAVTHVITTVAGTGVAGYSGDGGPAVSSQLSHPSGVAVDGQGNLYIADAGNQRVRWLNAATGVIDTLAGTGIAGYTGDGGPAFPAQLDNPAFVILDTVGNLFIDDSKNQRVREVSAGTGIIATVAGDGIAGYNGDGIPATAAELFNPSSVGKDFKGNLYIADDSNSRVRMVANTIVVYTPTPCGYPGNTCTPTATFTPTATSTPTATFTPSCVARAWPDPFNPKYAKDGKLKIGCVPPGASVSIYTLSGEAVWGTGQSSFQYGSPDTATWNGTNQNGVTVSPGVYYYAIQQGGQALQRGKFLVVSGP